EAGQPCSRLRVIGDKARRSSIIRGEGQKRPKRSLMNEVSGPKTQSPECAREWADAYKFCSKLLLSNQMGKGDYSQMGQELGQCMRGQVSKSCGGNDYNPPDDDRA